MKCEKPYNANGESLVSSSRVDSDMGLLGGGNFSLQGRTLDGKENIINIIYRNCKEMGLPSGVDWTWLLAIPGQESGWTTTAKSSAGAMGLFQFMPEFFPAYQRKAGCNESITDAECNTKAAICLFKDNWKHVEKVTTGLSLNDKIWATYICHNAGSGRFEDYYKKAGNPNNINAVIQVITNKEHHDFPILVNGFHNYAVDWLNKHPNAVSS